MPEAQKPDIPSALAAQALGEATPHEETTLRARMAADSNLGEEAGQLRAIADDLRTAARGASAGETSPMPASVRAELEDRRRALIAERSTRNSNAVRPANVIAPDNLPANDKPATSPQRHRALISCCAALAILGALAAIYFRPHPPAGFIAGRSPRLLAPTGETSRTAPLIVWENAADPAQLYDVWVLPPDGPFEKVPAIYEAKGVRSPVAFDRLAPPKPAAEGPRGLEPGRSYRLLVCIAGAGRIAGTAVPFSTGAAATGAPPTASDTTDSIQRAHRLLESGYPGDAMMVLAVLPETERALPEVRALMDEIKAHIPAPPR